VLNNFDLVVVNKLDNLFEIIDVILDVIYEIIIFLFDEILFLIA